MFLFWSTESAMTTIWRFDDHNPTIYQGVTKMTRWLSVFLVGRVIQVNVNGFLSDKISPIAGVPHGFVLSPLPFLIYVSALPKQHHRQNSKSQFVGDTALWAASKIVQFAAKLLRKDLRKLTKWCAKWRTKLNPEKIKVIKFSRSLSLEIQNPS